MLPGRNWLQHLRLHWRDIKAVSQYSVGSLEYLLDKHGDLFVDELGIVKSFSAKMSTLKLSLSFSVPYTLTSAIDHDVRESSKRLHIANGQLP